MPRINFKNAPMATYKLSLCSSFFSGRKLIEPDYDCKGTEVGNKLD
jgi:hypothetical protein